MTGATWTKRMLAGLAGAAALTFALPDDADAGHRHRHGWRHHHHHDHYGWWGHHGHHDSGFGATYVWDMTPPPPRRVIVAPPPPVVVYQQPPVVMQAPPPAYCREYTATSWLNGQPIQTYGTACMQPDGRWRIVN